MRAVRLWCGGVGCAWVLSAAGDARAATHTVYVGSATGGGSGGEGITQFQFDSAAGTLRDGKLAAATESPSWIVMNAEGTCLYAANESSSMVTAFKVFPHGGLEKLNSLPAGEQPGQGPCHLCLVPRARMLVASNYGGGTVSAYTLREDGGLERMSRCIQHVGHGGDPARQKGPHAHGAVLSPLGDVLLVSDLGLDKVLVYGAKPELPLLGETALPPEAGPRHGAFSASGAHFYSLNELNSTVTAFSWNGAALTSTATASTLPTGFTGKNSTAEIVVCGGNIYCSNRGHDSIAVLDGDLKPLGHTPTGGQVPRSFTISPDGGWLLAANVNSGSLVVLKRGADGLLAPTGQSAAVAKPLCVIFATGK